MDGQATQAQSEPQSGEKIAGKGVYVGKWAPKDRDGVSLGKIFNVYAAPMDLTGTGGRIGATFTYEALVKRVAELQSWHGFDGSDYKTDKELYQALQEGSYKGGWIIPTGDLLGSRDAASAVQTQPDSLYAHKNTGILSGTFTTMALVDQADYPDSYWSCTESRIRPDTIYAFCFRDGSADWDYKDGPRQSCRLVRLEETMDAAAIAVITAARELAESRLKTLKSRMPARVIFRSKP